MPVQRNRGMAALLEEQKQGGKPGVEPPVTRPGPGRPAGPLTVNDVPDPHDPSAEDGLTEADEAELQRCELALDNARLAFAAAGKALATVQQAKLYRQTYGTFEEYTQDRWGMGSNYAYRLIAAWPLAARLLPIGNRLRESHVRELLPLVQDYGEESAVQVYQVVAEAGGVQPTAPLLHDVVQLVADDYDPATAAAAIRAWLAGDRSGPAPASADPVQVITTGYERTVERRLSRLAKSDPGAARMVLSRIRADLDRLERELSS